MFKSTFDLPYFNKSSPYITTQVDSNKTTGGAMERAAMRDTPLKRVGEPVEIANVVVFLCTERGGWINGQVLGVKYV